MVTTQSMEKDECYSTLAGIYYHLTGVVDKPEDTPERKALSLVYAIEKFEGWEHKVVYTISRDDLTIRSSLHHTLTHI